MDSMMSADVAVVAAERVESSAWLLLLTSRHARALHKVQALCQHHLADTAVGLQRSLNQCTLTMTLQQ